MITTFQNEIYELFLPSGLILIKLLLRTLPSLAFKIFSCGRTHYLKNNKIPLIHGKLFKILSQAYFGGHVDMYIPSNIKHHSSFFKKVLDLLNLVRLPQGLTILILYILLV